MVEKKEKVQLTCWQKIDRQCRAFANFFYNKQTGEVMGRSSSSWGKTLFESLSTIFCNFASSLQRFVNCRCYILSYLCCFLGKIGLFYFVYYGFLTAFFAACLTVFLSTLNEPGKGGPKTNQFLHGDSAPG